MTQYGPISASAEILARLAQDDARVNAQRESYGSWRVQPLAA